MSARAGPPNGSADRGTHGAATTLPLPSGATPLRRPGAPPSFTPPLLLSSDTSLPIGVPDLDAGIAALAGARRILVLTGAGVSQESGVPTFRGPGGLWRDRRAEELATPGAFARDPVLVWEWYGARRETVAACAPNAAHHALARLAAAPGLTVTIATQNVDGLHRVAGAALATDAARRAAWPVELHGSLADARCTRCDHRGPLDGPVDATSRATLPACPACGALLRPGVVWFGEALDGPTLDAAHAAASSADACLVVGTSALVHPAAGLPLATAGRGGRIVEVNPEPTPLTGHATVAIRAAAASAVPALIAGVLAARPTA